VSHTQDDIDGDETYLLSVGEEIEQQAARDSTSLPKPLRPGPVGEVLHIKNAKKQASSMYGRLNGVGAGSNTADVGSVALASVPRIIASALRHANLSA
jgi:hypothetical protein